jgi:hypothetical protein
VALVVVDSLLVEPLVLAATGTRELAAFAAEPVPSLVLQDTRSREAAAPAGLPGAVLQACAVPQRRWCIRQALEPWAVRARIAPEEAALSVERGLPAAGLDS